MAGRILVLDDEENYAEMLQDLLRENNFRVDMSTRPERAIDQLEEIPYDLVISDYKMPVMDGADFLKKARELYPKLPFILVSGLMNTPELVKVANMSVTLVMEKPLDTDAFLGHVARFSEPMTDQEKEAVANESKEAGSAANLLAYSYPEEPRFFSAGCAVSKLFMQNAWNLSKQGSHLFILEPKGGDGELAVKDISVWRGNSDHPVSSITFSDLLTDGVAYVKSVLDQPEVSNVISVRLTCLEQIAEARGLMSKFQDACDRPNGILFVYILESELGGTEFKDLAAENGVILPALLNRPTDIALYARRFARLNADRLDKPKCADFSSEVVYAILTFDWPGNYKQIQAVVAEAVSGSENEPLTLALFEKALGLSADSIPAPSGRLSVMMKNAQQRHICNILSASAVSTAELASNLSLDPSVHTKAGLMDMPLVDPKLSHL